MTTDRETFHLQDLPQDWDYRVLQDDDGLYRIIECYYAPDRTLWGWCDAALDNYEKLTDMTNDLLSMDHAAMCARYDALPVLSPSDFPNPNPTH